MITELLIEQKLLAEFSPLYLDIEESGFDLDFSGKKHLHVNVIIISNRFEGQKIHSRHKAINKVLAKELMENLSVLTLNTYTEKEWIYRHDALPYFLINKEVESKGVERI